GEGSPFKPSFDKRGMIVSIVSHTRFPRTRFQRVKGNILLFHLAESPTRPDAPLRGAWFKSYLVRIQEPCGPGFLSYWKLSWTRPHLTPLFAMGVACFRARVAEFSVLTPEVQSERPAQR